MKALRKDQWLTLAIVGVMLVTFVAVVFLPQRGQLRTLRAECVATAGALERDKERSVELARIRGEVARMNEQLSFFNRRLPDQPELGQFLKDVSGFAQEAGLDGAIFQPQRATRGETYFQMSIEMKFKGSFAQLYRFLRLVRTMPRLTHVQLLNVQNDQNLAGQCTIDLEMTIFFTRG